MAGWGRNVGAGTAHIGDSCRRGIPAADELGLESAEFGDHINGNHSRKSSELASRVSILDEFGHGWKMVQNYSAKWTYQLPASQAGTLGMVFGLTQGQWRARD